MGGFGNGKWNLDNLTIRQPREVTGIHCYYLMAVIITEGIPSKLATGRVLLCCHSFRSTAFLLKSESNKTSLQLIILELLNFNQCANYICLDVLDGPQIQNTKKRFHPLQTFNIIHTGGGNITSFSGCGIINDLINTLNGGNNNLRPNGSMQQRPHHHYMHTLICRSSWIIKTPLWLLDNIQSMR